MIKRSSLWVSWRPTTESQGIKRPNTEDKWRKINYSIFCNIFCDAGIVCRLIMRDCWAMNINIKHIHSLDIRSVLMSAIHPCPTSTRMITLNYKIFSNY